MFMFDCKHIHVTILNTFPWVYGAGPKYNLLKKNENRFMWMSINDIVCVHLPRKKKKSFNISTQRISFLLVCETVCMCTAFTIVQTHTMPNNKYHYQFSKILMDFHFDFRRLFNHRLVYCHDGQCHYGNISKCHNFRFIVRVCSMLKLNRSFFLFGCRILILHRTTKFFGE